MRRLNITKKWVLPLVAAGSVAGGLLGGALFHAGSGNAAQATTTTSTTRSPNLTPGTFHPNEDPSHEANESKEREAQEDAGQFPTVP